MIRSSEGEITGRDFRKGAKFLFVLTLIAFGVFYGISVLSHSMEWMTVVVAPFFGGIIFLVVCSLIYFWFCIFTKRSRALGHSPMLIFVWLAAMFLASALRLLDYQNRTLVLAEDGILTYAGFGALVFSILAVILFIFLIARNWAAD